MRTRVLVAVVILVVGATAFPAMARGPEGKLCRIHFVIHSVTTPGGTVDIDATVPCRARKGCRDVLHARCSGH